MKSFLAALFFCLSCSVIVTAQHHPAPSIAPSTKPAGLMPGLGDHHFPVSSANAQAQRFFDQGLMLVYGFNHAEAIRSFQQAAELDPQMAMAHWGIALATGPNYNESAISPERQKAAYEAVQKALKLSAKAPEYERAYIEALSTRFSIDPKADKTKLALDYKNAMEALAKRYPDDLEAATLYAESLMLLNPWKLWSTDGHPEEGTSRIIEVLESVLRRNPEHIGANHFYIHAVEASPHPEYALPSAMRLGAIAPAAGHLVHMPAHIFMRIGDYVSAARSNELAVEADQAYFKATNALGRYRGYYAHNLYFLTAAYSMQGRYEDAKRTAEQYVEAIRPLVKEIPRYEGGMSSPILVLVRFRRWDDILKLPQPSISSLVTTAAWHFARGLAQASTANPDKAEAEQSLFAAALAKIPATTRFGANTAQAVLKIAENVLAARVATAKQNRKLAIEFLRKAVEAEDALAYSEPPDWYYSPSRESLGAALLLNDEPAEAEKVFRVDLERNRRNGRSLFGLLESLKAQGKNVDARMVQREFEAAWKNADSQIRIEDL